MEDQLRFASLTGDANPLHVDPVAARRLMTGRPVVHGIHTLLAALEALPTLLWPELSGLVCNFANPISIDEEVHFELPTPALVEAGTAQPDDEHHWSLIARVNQLECTEIQLTRLTDDPAMRALPVESIDDLQHPLDRPPEDWSARRVRMPLPRGRFDAAFPGVCGHLGERAVAALGLLSTYVGMVCPGLNSVFAGLEFTLGQPSSTSNWLEFELLRHDPRFNLYVVAFRGQIVGRLRAFARPPFQTQVGSLQLADRLGPRVFAGRRALVVGGSRGLGEVCAKMAAAGGADVTITYVAGASDAQRVADDINAAGRGTCAVTRFDVVHDEILNALPRAAVPDAVFYFATPRIFRKRGVHFDGALFDEFVDVYIRHFARLCEALDGLARPVTVFLPSSIAIEERPRGMTEYAMGKMAAEVLAADLARSLTNVRFVSRRLPRLSTDQTVTIMPVKVESNVDTLLPIVIQALAGERPVPTRK